MANGNHVRGLTERTLCKHNLYKIQLTGALKTVYSPTFILVKGHTHTHTHTHTHGHTLTQALIQTHSH